MTERKQRLERCVLLVESCGASADEKAETLSYIAGSAAILAGIEAQGYAGGDSAIDEALARVDQLCSVIETNTAPTM